VSAFTHEGARQEQKPMNRGRGKHLCRIRNQDQQWPSGGGHDSGIFGPEAGEDVTWLSSIEKRARVKAHTFVCLSFLHEALLDDYESRLLDVNKPF